VAAEAGAASGAFLPRRLLVLAIDNVEIDPIRTA
jgi:hypothetical protein